MKHVLYILLLMLSAGYGYSQDDFSYFKNRLDSILEKYPEPLTDSDSDGIDDPMEYQIGTDPFARDSDSDGLDDYLEMFKYHTNPVNDDSDNDGIVDSVWSERREYSYVIKIGVRIGKPFDVQKMDSFNHDVRILSNTGDYIIAEYIVYPFAIPYLVPLRKAEAEISADEYLDVDTLTRLSSKQQKEVQSIIANAGSEMEKAILLIYYLWDSFELKDELFSRCEPLMEIKVSDSGILHVHDGWSPGELYSKYSFDTVLKLNCIADEMIKNKSRGACGSTATLIASLFKNAGIPARIRQSIPYVTDKDPVQIALINNVKNTAGIPEKYRTGMYGDNHFYNELFLNGHWIDLDTYRLGNKWLYKPYLKTVHFNNWSDIDFAGNWEPWISYDKQSAESLAIRYKAYKTIYIEEVYPRY